jgi:hypothetical protein
LTVADGTLAPDESVTSPVMLADICALRLGTPVSRKEKRRLKSLFVRIRRPLENEENEEKAQIIQYSLFRYVKPA